MQAFQLSSFPTCHHWKGGNVAIPRGSGQFAQSFPAFQPVVLESPLETLTGQGFPAFQLSTPKGGSAALESRSSPRGHRAWNGAPSAVGGDK